MLNTCCHLQAISENLITFELQLKLCYQGQKKVLFIVLIIFTELKRLTDAHCKNTATKWFRK